MSVDPDTCPHNGKRIRKYGSDCALLCALCRRVVGYWTKNALGYEEHLL